MKTKKPKINVRLLRRVQKAILNEPHQFNMTWWFSKEDVAGNTPPNCGTAACIGGWAIALSNGMTPALAYENRHSLKPINAASMLILGEPTGVSLTERGSALFLEEDWPEPFRSRYAKAFNSGNAKRAAKAASDRIDHFIKTGK